MDPDLAFSLNQINRDIKKEYTSLRNRIQSILFDNAFIAQRVIPRFPNYPLIPNERCGLWYCDPKDFDQTSYFKSTDGHTNQWDFSTRRLNLHLLPILQEKNGIIIVDSTRRGKLMPDALSKTIPIWCAVLNSLMQPDKSEVLFTPPKCVSQSEHDSIKTRIPSLVDRLEKLDILDAQDLRNKFQGKILRPFWVYPGSDMLRSSTDPFTGEIIEIQWEPGPNEQIIPIILCTASYRAQDGVDKRHGFTYVQGAADDHELWSCGLDPKLLWNNWHYFHDLDRNDKELESHVKTLIELAETTDHRNHLADIVEMDPITKELSLGKLKDHTAITPNIARELDSQFSLVIILSQSVTLSKPFDFIKTYNLQSGSKRSSKDLRAALIEIDHIVSAHLNKDVVKRKPIMVCCNSGTDISVGVILMILCKYYSQDWLLGKPDSVNKFVIRRHLVQIINKIKRRNVNPSRATLNSINSFLM
ncbi:hypothetical protein ZYGR_0AD03570 [Zygosaccharomyces rouxii]|uniref:ZYRO0G14344p n=2 Tax=Zygosaccharomyces rouxii TaxID=4956 RepID=C5E0N9_ZYGRC|nr:uncharacterized protein ZYRO0G14344g [Zygosaccharomyces rouxii]KAH9202667.1 tRNA A64-2'-O-ribosylphosphate transferase [Zygosaccharomyces rouxii]GAV51174.1 hypothetical protein ZYGR_0AD03570 [Zygosaccharomyces rouxii]CAR29673.1 ZYRO0G14344p [Zygosaccharomyces rouxii]